MVKVNVNNAEVNMSLPFLDHLEAAREKNCLAEFSYEFELLNSGASTSLSSSQKQEMRSRPDKLKSLEREISTIKAKEQALWQINEKLLKAEGSEKTVSDILLDESYMQILFEQIKLKGQHVEQQNSVIETLKHEIAELEIQKESELKLHTDLLEQMNELN